MRSCAACRCLAAPRRLLALLHVPVLHRQDCDASDGSARLKAHMQDELVLGGHMRPPPQAALAKVAAVKARKAVKRAGGSPGKRAFREFTSPAGLKVGRLCGVTWTRVSATAAALSACNMLCGQVLVGRNPRENDELTRSAADADLWFHARGCPGSHAILRVPASGCVSLACCGAPLYGFRDLSHGLLVLQGAGLRGRHLCCQPGSILFQSTERGQAPRHCGARQGCV